MTSKDYLSLYFSYTKMRNVAGISGASSQRAMDMHQKCQYINEISGGKGVVYLTGTPVSNSMSELYVLQKTLQPQELKRRDLLMFDAWAGTFGKVVSSLEIKPEGNGYQMKNRFAQFHNLPELMNMFAMIADIKTADMLDLPTPRLKTGGVQVVRTACTPEQKRIVMELAQRAENIRDRKVDSSVDNFLKLTHEARLLSVDPRALDPTLPDDPDTKLNVGARNVAQIYHDTAGQKLTQIIFCDQGTPKDRVNSAGGEREGALGGDGTFNFYEATRAALFAQGVKPEEIAFIHDAKTDVQREQLFEKVRNGEIRILMGSTQKMGTGMNVQNKVIALHHLDIPLRPSDLTQRNGRGLRQGNENEEISIFNYITENTFDAYLFQILEQKQRYISQIMTGRSALRTCEDLDETVLQYAEFKALATSDPRVKDKMEVDNEINRLTVLKSAWQTQQNDLRYNITRRYPDEIAKAERRIEGMTADLAAYAEMKPAEFQMMIDGKFHEERTKAAEHFMVCSRKLGRAAGDTLDIGSYAGFTVRLLREWSGSAYIQLCGKCTYQTDMGESELGNITRIENLAQRMIERKGEEEQKLESLNRQLAASKEESKKPFADGERLVELQQRKVALDLALEFKEEVDDDMMTEDNGQGKETKKQPDGLTARLTGIMDRLGGPAAQADAPTPRTDSPTGQEMPLTLEQQLYQKLEVLAASVLDGSAKCMKRKLKPGSFADLEIEDIGDGKYSIAHYYMEYGDIMSDMEIIFKFDKKAKSVHPISFLQTDERIVYDMKTAPPEKAMELKQFMGQWLTAINNQCQGPEPAGLYEQDEESGETAGNGKMEQTEEPRPEKQEENMNFKSMDRYIDYINEKVLDKIDYGRLQADYGTEEKIYAKSVLNALHQGLQAVYGTETLDWERAGSNVLVPGVVQSKSTGELCIALLELDLASSGEHCGTDFLICYGCISQLDPEMPEEVRAFIQNTYGAYDYGYTATLMDDIQMDKASLPQTMREVLGDFRRHEFVPCDEEQGLQSGEPDQDQVEDFER